MVLFHLINHKLCYTINKITKTIKKILIISLLFATLYSNGQIGFKLGVGLNFSNSLSKIDPLNTYSKADHISKLQPGFFIEPTVSYRFGEKNEITLPVALDNLNVKYQILKTYRTWYRWETIKRYSLYRLNTGLNFKHYFLEDKIYAEIGAKGGYNIAKKQKLIKVITSYYNVAGIGFSDDPALADENTKVEFKDFFYGFNLGGAYKINKNFYVKLNANLETQEASGTIYNDVYKQEKSLVFKIGLEYIF